MSERESQERERESDRERESERERERVKLSVCKNNIKIYMAFVKIGDRSDLIYSPARNARFTSLLG